MHSICRAPTSASKVSQRGVHVTQVHVAPVALVPVEVVHLAEGRHHIEDDAGVYAVEDVLVQALVDVQG